MYCAFPRKARLPHKSQRRPSGGHSQQLFKEALCTACHTKASCGPAAAMRAAVCTAPASCGPAATTRAAPPEGSAYCACHTTASRGQRTAPATRHPARASGSFCRRLCVLRLPHDSQPRASGDYAHSSSSRKLCIHTTASHGPFATTPAAAPLPGSSVYCACHTTADPGPAATRRAAAPQGSPACVLRLPHDSQPRASGDHAPGSPVTASRGPAPGGSVYCACHATASRGPAATTSRGSVYCACRASSSRRTTHTAAPSGGSVCCTSQCCGQPRAQQLLQEALCTAPATRQPAAGQWRPRAQQHVQEALCTAPATQQPAARQPTTRAAACPGSSLYCACHTTACRGPAATTRAAAPPGGSVYCACHTTASQPRASGDHACSSSSGRLRTAPATAVTSGVMSCAVMSAV